VRHTAKGNIAAVTPISLRGCKFSSDALRTRQDTAVDGPRASSAAWTVTFALTLVCLREAHFRFMNKYDGTLYTNAAVDGPRASSPAWNVTSARKLVCLREADASLQQMRARTPAVHKRRSSSSRSSYYFPVKFGLRVIFCFSCENSSISGGLPHLPAPLLTPSAVAKFRPCPRRGEGNTSLHR
jgi:hypothetical protein